jgi:hypothetical protein
MIIPRPISKLPLIALSLLACASCSVMQPLHSKPPFSKIVLTKPFNGEGFMFHLNMPAGEYRPAYEEGRAYYYQAPGQLAIRTMATEYVDGGFYVDGGTKALRGWWYFDSEGNPNTGALTAPPPGFKAVP